MNDARWARAKEIFLEARERHESDRRGYVAAQCEGDEALRADVESLLSADDDAGAFLAAPTQGNGRSGQPVDPADTFARLQRALAGRYSLEREIGRGGMGVVYLARDVALDRPVAIKLLPPAQASEPQHRERFLREARTAAALSHPNIVPIHLVEERDDLVYFVMAYVDGESLGDRVRRAGPLKPPDAATLVQEVAWALAYAHANGVIHRDVKPDNILIDAGSGRAMVTDFGIARMTSTGTMSQQGEILGTLQYMSPEQAGAAEVIDGRADVYSLGATAFFALTGRLPFESDNPAALVAMHLTEPAPPLLSVSSAVPARVAEAVDRCLAKDPDARFASGEALAEAIADAQVTRREIAPTVREFLGVAKSSAAQLAVLWLVWWSVIESLPRIQGATGRILGTPLDPLFVLLAGLTPIVLARPFLAARGVIRAGLDHHDVADAVSSSTKARDANVEYELGRAERLGRWLSTIWGRGASLLLSGAMLTFVVDMIGDLITYDFALPLVASFQTLFPLAGFAFVASITIAPKRVIGVLTRGTPEFARAWRRLWSGPLGRALFRLAGVGLKRGASVPAPEAAPTELLLGRAAVELFDQLPEDQRARLGDVQEVIRDLERAAGTLRLRRDELTAAIADVGPSQGEDRRGTLVAELQETQAVVETRLASAVSALENLRLDLLRLRAGVGTADDLTKAIQEARAVGDEVDVEIAARKEVEEAVGP